MILRQLIIHWPPDAALIHISQLDRQSLLGKVLIADRAREPENRLGLDFGQFRQKVVQRDARGHAARASPRSTMIN
jgi:hypothetical protein